MFVSGMLLLILAALGLIAWEIAALTELLRGRLRAEPECRKPEPEPERGAETEERMSPAMLEGFDNLMSYTEKTAREARS